MCRLLSISNVANICVLLVSSFLDRVRHGHLSLHPTVIARKPQQHEPQAQLTLFAAALLEAFVSYIRQHVRFVYPTLRKLTPATSISLSSTAISRLMMNLRDPFLRNPQRLPTKVAPIASEALPVVEIVRTTRKDDLEAGSPSAPKNPRAVDVTDAIRSFLLATPPRPPIQAPFHQPAWRVNTVDGSDQATVMV